MTHRDLKPSDIMLVGPVPLCDTLKRTEREMAAMLVVRVCQVAGDTWQPVTFAQIRDVLAADVAAGIEPLASVAGNPFLRPDVDDLVRKGYATNDEKGLALTQEAIDRIAAKWRRIELPAVDVDRLIAQRDQARAAIPRAFWQGAASGIAASFEGIAADFEREDPLGTDWRVDGCRQIASNMRRWAGER